METNLVQCKVCKELKVKTEAGKYPGQNGKTKKYVDQFNKQWNGRMCPKCNQERAKNTMRANRLKEPTND